MNQQIEAGATNAQGDEEKVRRFIEKVTGGHVVGMERLIRWRPAWFADVERNGDLLWIHVRGDRDSDILPFPELQREADIMRILGENGVPVPHIYGVCEDPSAIVMEAIPGTRDVGEAEDDQERHQVARQFVEALVAMHRVPVKPFVEKGVRLPEGPEEIALVGLDAYMPLYRRNKKKPEPLLEFAVRWLRDNIPRHRTEARFIQFDCGQFLYENGRMTGLYDFEFAMIGDPMTDLATIRMRESYEPHGVAFREICRLYEEISGEPIDVPVLLYHNVLFATVSCMMIAGTVAEPSPGDPHDVYLEWDIALRRTLIQALSESMGVELETVEPVAGSPGPNAAMLGMLRDTLDHLEVPDAVQQARKDSALNLLECIERGDRMGAELDRRALAEAAEILGTEPGTMAEMDSAMEAFAQTAGPEHHEDLLRFFARQVERRVQVYGPTGIGRSADNVALPPIR